MSPVFRNSRSKYRRSEMYSSIAKAMPRGVVVVNIYVVNSRSNLTSVVSYKRKYVHEVPVNCLFKLAQEEVRFGELTVPPYP